jgi:CRISPR/Cas system-associated endoribonuclease Cas2
MAAALKRLGLTRIQRSAFIGPYSSSIVIDIYEVTGELSRSVRLSRKDW